MKSNIEHLQQENLFQPVLRPRAHHLTGKPAPVTDLSLPASLGTQDFLFFEVRYKTVKGDIMGPFDVSFSPLLEARPCVKLQIEMGWYQTEWLRFMDIDEFTSNIFVSRYDYC